MNMQYAFRFLILLLILKLLVFVPLGANELDTETNSHTVKPQKNDNPKDPDRGVNPEKKESYNLNRPARTLYVLGYLAERKGNLEKAIAYYRASAEKDPLAKTYYRLAYVQFNFGESNDAENNAKNAIKADKNYLDAYMLLARIALHKKNPEEALGYYSSVINLDERHAKAHLQMARIYFSRKDWSKASRHYIQILNIAALGKISNEVLIQAYYALANNFTIKNDYEMALRYFERANELNPRNMRITIRLANLYYYLGKYDLAIEKYRVILSYYPGNYKVATRIAELYFLADNDFMVQKFLKQASYFRFKGSQTLEKSKWINYTPKVVQAFSLYYKGDYDKAKALFLSLLKGNYKNPAIHYALVKVFAELNDEKSKLKSMFTTALLLSQTDMSNRSERFYRELIDKSENSRKYRYYLARLLERNKSYYLAILEFKKLLNEKKDNYHYLIHLAYLFTFTDQEKRSLKVYDQILLQKPNDPQVYFLKGISYYRLQDYAKARIAFTMAAQLKETPDYYYHLAAAWEKLGNAKEAITAARKAIKLDPQDGKSNNFLGYLYADYNQNLNEAVDLIYTALESDPENAAYQDSLGWAYFKMGNLRKAYEHVKLSIQYFKKEDYQDPVAYEHLGDILLKTGKFNEAIHAWEQGIKLYGENKENNTEKEILKLKQKIDDARKNR